MGAANQPHDQEVMDHLTVASSSAALAPALGWVAGFVDAVGFLSLFGVFLTFQSGNSVLLGVSIGQAHWGDAVQFLTPICAFTFGVALGTALLARLKTRNGSRVLTRMLAVEIVLIALFLGMTQTVIPIDGLRPNVPGFFLLVLVAGMAAGVQTMSLTRSASVEIRTTYVSGVLTTAAVNLTGSLVRRDAAGRRAALQHAGVAGRLWLLYVIGGACGAFGYVRANTLVLVFPVLVLAVIVTIRIIRVRAAEQAAERAP